MGAYLRAALFALVALATPSISHAAEATPIRSRPSVVSVAPAGSESTIIIEQSSPTRPAPTVRYGCSRIWRCDAVICEWRRGCWGVYGYMEGPYYTLDLAKRQWERHGWPTPERERAHYSFSK